MNTRNGLLICMLVLAGCAREDRAAEPPAAVRELDAAVAPAIIPPEAAADPAQPPSYEVAIAAAAAGHNKALERCAKQPEAVRTQCEQEANAAFAEAGSSLESLRGNQP